MQLLSAFECFGVLFLIKYVCLHVLLLCVMIVAYSQRDARIEEQDPAKFKQPDYDQGKCRHRLIILNLLINIIYLSCMCPMQTLRT